MDNPTPFQQFIRQCLLYPLTSPFLPPANKVQKDFSYSAGQLIGTLEAGSPPSLPKTGESADGYDYDDGYYHDGNPVSPRFPDQGDNTVKDMATGIMWIIRPELIIPDGLNVNNIGVERGDYLQGASYSPGDIVTDSSYGSAYVCLIADNAVDADFASERGDYSANWQATIWATSNYSGGVNPNHMVWDSSQGSPDALTACKNLVKSGNNDWKCPNIKELQSIVDYGRQSPAIDPVFANCQSDYYWSSSLYVPDPDYAWFVNFNDGYVYLNNRVNAFYVRPCRQY